MYMMCNMGCHKWKSLMLVSHITNSEWHTSVLKVFRSTTMLRCYLCSYKGHIFGPENRVNDLLCLTGFCLIVFVFSEVERCHWMNYDVNKSMLHHQSWCEKKSPPFSKQSKNEDIILQFLGVTVNIFGVHLAHSLQPKISITIMYGVCGSFENSTARAVITKQRLLVFSNFYGNSFIKVIHLNNGLPTPVFVNIFIASVKVITQLS